MLMSSPLRVAAGLAAAAALAVAAPSAHALPRQNVCGPGWQVDYSNDVWNANYWDGQAQHYWDEMDHAQSQPELDYAYQQLEYSLGNRDSYQRRADQLLRSCA
jgi:hypothetical protein